MASGSKEDSPGLVCWYSFSFSATADSRTTLLQGEGAIEMETAPRAALSAEGMSFRTGFKSGKGI